MMVACPARTGHTAGHYHSEPPSARPGSFAEEGTMRRLHTLFQDGCEEAATASRRGLIVGSLKLAGGGALALALAGTPGIARLAVAQDDQGDDGQGGQGGGGGRDGDGQGGGGGRGGDGQGGGGGGRGGQ